MIRAAWMVAAGIALGGCYDVTKINPRPTRYSLVRNHMTEMLESEFRAKPDMHEGLRKFLQKTEQSATRIELKAAWAEAFPGRTHLLDSRVIDRSVMDAAWPPMTGEDDRPFLRGVRDATEEFLDG